MWFQFCFSVVFVHVLGTISAKHVSKTAIKPPEPEAIFANVIKNISRVNNVLQDLISNYEHLQKIYKSQENLESASSDDEVDEVFKNKKKQRVRSNTEATTIKGPDYLPATQLIWSGDETKVSSSENNSESTETEKKSEETQVSNNLETKLIAKKEPAAPIQAERSESDEKSIEKLSTAKENDSQSKPAKIVFVDTHKATLSVVKYKQNEEVDMTDHQSSKPPKTRYSKVSKIKQVPKQQRQEREKPTDKPSFRINGSYNNKEHRKNKPKTKEHRNNVEKSRKVEKKLHSESFSPKDIWGEIINNKPIQLETHNEMIFQKMRKDNRKLKKTFRYEEDKKPKTALVIVTNNNKDEKINKDIKEIADSDEEFVKDEFQARVLREAYGDACLKVVIKKCFKACKAARKSVCINYTCKNTAKHKFDHSARVGCLREFDKLNNTNHNNHNNHNHHNNHSHHNHHNNHNHHNKQTSIINITKSGEVIRNDTYGDTESNEYDLDSRKYKHSKEYKKRADDDKLFNDMTRDGYLQACLPHIDEDVHTRVSVEPVVEKKLEPAFPPLFPKEGTNFNILRDKYETACKKMSYGKCNNACEFAYHETCEAYTCNRSKKRAFKKACRSRCKSAYKLSHGSSSSGSGSDSSDSSSGGSDSDSSSE